MLKRIAAAGCVLALVITGAVQVRGRTAVGARAPELERLGSLFDLARGAVRDTNADGLADSVVARVIVPATPAIEDIEAATNIAGRLGFETTAMTLPLVVRDDQVADASAIDLPIFVGRDNAFVKKLAEAGAIDLKALKPGQGLVSVVQSPGGGHDGIIIVGGDGAGTLAAAVELAARLPRLWTMSGVTLTGIEQQAAQYMKASGLAVSRAAVVAMVVDSDRRGIASVTVNLHVKGTDAARAVKLLEALDLAHRRGQLPGMLNFAEAATTLVAVVADGKTAGRASVRRSGLNGRTLTPPVDPEEFMPDPAAASSAGGGRGAGGGGAAGAAGAAAPTGTSSAQSGSGAASGAAAAPEGGGAGGGVAAVPVTAKLFDLSNTYSNDGWFGDAFVDLIPDRTETTLVLGNAQDSLGAAHIAARLGLESTGISLPITKTDDKVRDPAREPSPILIGRTNTYVQQLVKIGRARLDDLQPGQGTIQIVPRAFGVATATVVAGADQAGTDAASLYLARRAPYLWDIARGAFSYDDLITEATRFLGGKSGAGQAAQAVQELGSLLDGLKGKKVETLDAKLYLEKGDAAFAKYLAGQATQALPGAKVNVTSQGVTDPVPVFEDKPEIPWEVDEFWAKFKADVLPKVKAGSTVDLEVRLSEPPEIRKSLVEQAQAELTKAGAVKPRVKVLSAYKQGYLWLTEQVIPELKGKGGRSVHIKVLTHKPDFTKKYKFYMVPSRWLQELFPVDEVFERDLGIRKDAFTMELVDDQKDIYAVEVADGAGKIVYRGTFNPKFVEREYLDKFPGWANVEVTTGWISATVNGQSAVDARIATDPERLWDYYQAKVLPKVYDHVMKVTAGRPTTDKQPFFRDLDIEVWMSEPDFRIGVDEEQISSLESLHEDLYFVTLDFFSAMGRTITRQRIGAPGKILPIIHPSRSGKPGSARILYAANAATAPRLEVTYKEKDGEKPVSVTRPLGRIDTTAPQALRAVVRNDRVSEIELQVEAGNDREAARAADALDGLARLHAAGLYREALSFDHVDGVAIAIGIKEIRTRRVIKNTGSTLPSNIRTAQQKPALPVVTWDHVISPDEAEDIVKKLSAYPEVKAYRVGQSYRGRDMSVMEVTLPTPSELVSVTKLTAYKPTIFMMGRQHANEVSSTSHILRLAELLATDPKYRDILKKVNVILDPVMNPDGAQIAFDLQKLTPNHMLHAGRYSALGMDVTSRQNNLLPEAEVEGQIWREWLPDIYLNPHGYPSHEWVQQFSGYVSPQFRAYWTSRGWYTMISGLRDPRYPDIPEATAALREAVVRDVSGNADVRAMDLRAQARYLRWANGFGTHVYNIQVYKDTTIFFSDPESGELRGSRRAPATPQAGQSAQGGGRRGTMGSFPQVTFNSGMTEAPDETAQGPWLNLVTKAGFSFLMAHVTYLQDGHYKIERIEEAGQRDGSTLTVLRVRPVMPGRTPAVAGAPRKAAPTDAR
ncbi:MAG: M14 family zinc carboxypeptidase [Acidobacteria bacterium]|nr:M14 family zinc carboxypeptidase [Acidobacteriota bacterium]